MAGTAVAVLVSIIVLGTLPADRVWADTVNLPVDVVLQAMPDDPPGPQLLRAQALASELLAIRNDLQTIATQSLTSATKADADALARGVQERLDRADTLVDDLQAAQGDAGQSDARIATLRAAMSRLRADATECLRSGTSIRAVKALALASLIDSWPRGPVDKNTTLGPIQPTLRIADGEPVLVASKQQLETAEAARRAYDATLPPLRTQ